jgi:UDP-N-acetylmuramoylalanine--D-glutamate ligase
MVGVAMTENTVATNSGAAQFDSRRIAVVGIGKSGRAVLDVLGRLTRAELSAWDADPGALAGLASPVRAESYADPQELAQHVIAWHPDLIVPAPAISELAPLYQEAARAHIPLMGEIELAWRLRAVDGTGEAAPWLCVTGTNGKTTTVSMAAAILQKAGLGGTPLGNIGNPAITETTRCDTGRAQAFVLELSSFQLRVTSTMQPHAAMCLNIDDDHLEWHGSFAAYRNAKARIYHGVRNACLYPVGDAVVQRMVDEADVAEGARAIGVTPGVPAVGQIGVVEGIVVDRAFCEGHLRGEALELFELSDLAHLAPAGGELPLHIVKDALAASALVRSLGVVPTVIRAALREFQSGKHRIELVGTRGGVHFVDDSKATNAHATRASLLAQPDDSVVWIVGGLAKGARFEHLVADVRPKIHAAVVIGTDQDVWRAAFSDATFPVTWIDPASTEPMAQAVRASQVYARPGDTVLLAPATASFDQFASYADRGDKFREAVEAIDG